MDLAPARSAHVGVCGRGDLVDEWDVFGVGVMGASLGAPRPRV